MSDKSTTSISAAIPIEGRNSFGAFMKLFRISNSPTIISNVLVGAAVAASIEPNSFPNITHVIAVTTSLVLIYIAGMAINDYFDQVVDTSERPTRPIPSGQISTGTALLCGVGLLLLGMIACAFVSLDVLPWVMLLGSAVLAYNMLHLAKFVGPLLMSMCRMLVPIIAAIALSPSQAPEWTILIFFALPLGAATFGISLAARNEMQRKNSAGDNIQTHKSARTMFAAALIGIASIAPMGAIATRVLAPMPDFMTLTYVVSLTLACFAFFRGLTYIAHPLAAHLGVMHWIAALSLLDAGSLCILNQPILAYVAIACFIATTLLQRRVAGS